MPQPGGIKAEEQGANKRQEDSFLELSAMCVKFLEGKSVYGRGSGKTSNPPWHKGNGAGGKCCFTWCFRAALSVPGLQ